MYKAQVMSLNISPHFYRQNHQKVQVEEETSLLCYITKEQIKIPVRHNNVNNIGCIFELNFWLEYVVDNKTIDKDFIICPGCKEKVMTADFGVDISLYNVISLLNYIDPQQTKFRRDKLVYMFSEQLLFYGISKQDSSIKILLPGCSPLESEQKRKKQYNQMNLQTNLKVLRISQKQWKDWNTFIKRTNMKPQPQKRWISIVQTNNYGKQQNLCKKLFSKIANEWKLEIVYYNK